MTKHVSYTSTNTYDTLNELTTKTKTVWLVCHGIGYLSRYFIRLFESLDPEENYIIAPQAPSKYYKDASYRKVGASWLTKENTQIDTENALNYIDAVIDSEKIPDNVQFHVLGYSQGVSIASRWIARLKIIPDVLLFISGGFPKELTKDDFDFLASKTKIIYIVGENDPYFDPKNVTLEIARVNKILPQMQFRTHDGGHELDVSTFEELF